MIAQFSEAVSAANARVAEFERQHKQHREQLESQYTALEQTRSELHTKTALAEQQAAKIADLESLLQSSQREAAAHRDAAAGGLNQLLALPPSTREIGAERDAANMRSDRQIGALHEEVRSLQQLHEEARAASTQLATQLQQATERNGQQQRANNMLFSEVNALRTQLNAALHEMASLRERTARGSSNADAAARQLEVAQLKSTALRQLLLEAGMGVPDDETLSRPSFLADRRVAELERELETHRRAAEVNAADLQHAQEQLHAMGLEWERRMRDSHAHERASPRAELVALRQRAEEAELRLEKATAAHNERAAQLESDYQTAVQFVRNTENMLRRLKEEHLKLRQDNAELRASLAAHTGDPRGYTHERVAGTRSVSDAAVPAASPLNRKAR